MPSKNTKNVVLTDHYVDFVDRLTRSGRYQNASEVMRAGLRALEDRFNREEAELAEIRHRIARSLDQLDRGENGDRPVEEVFDRAFSHAKERRGG